MIEQFLWLPVTPYRLHQGFGENKACVSNLDNKTVVTKEQDALCPPNFRSLYAATNGHNGLDLMAYRWQPIYAAHDGIVNEVATEIERGLGIGIVSNEKRYFKESNSIENYKTRYWHLIALDVHLGQKIKTGDFIGYADSTGYSSGDHLHFELKPVTIKDYENGVPVVANVLQNNTHLGAIDALPYMNLEGALVVAGLIRRIQEFSAKLADYIADKLRKR